MGELRGDFGIRRSFWGELRGVFGVPAAYSPQILGIILPKTRNKCLFSEMLCARSFKNHSLVALKIALFSLSHTFPFTQAPLQNVLRSPTHSSRPLQGSICLRALLRGLPERLSQASQSPPEPLSSVVPQRFQR